MTRRQCLEALVPRRDTHAALWFDRFPSDLEETGIVANHLGAGLEALRVPIGYRTHFLRYQAGLATLRPVTLTAVATVRGRLALGLGRASILENSIGLHHTYGVPMLPGSSLKGLASAFARQEVEDPAWKLEGVNHEITFGRLEESGYVTFHDALWIPPAAAVDPITTRLPLALDVMTVHHQNYYGGQSPPAEWDEPIPIGFLTATGSYQIALTGPREWAEAALDLLVLGLGRLGLGAKTAVGYGRMDVEWTCRHIRIPEPKVPVRAPVVADVAPSEPPSVLPSLAGLGNGREGSEIPKILAHYEAQYGIAGKRKAARELVDHFTVPELKKNKKKDWAQALLSAANEE